MRWHTAVLFCFLDLLIIGLAISARTAAPLVSPWDVLPIWIFGIFGVSTGLLAYNLHTLREHQRIAVILCMLHGITTWWTSLLLYRFGFGFDPFIHQAAERHLSEHGTIGLKTPLYVGQYALVAALHWITRLSVIRIDQWLVPVLSLGLIPLLARAHRFSPIVLFLLPVAAFSFTIPFHLALLLFIGAILLAKDATTRKAKILLITCAIGCLLTHPLIGIPCGLLVLAVLLQDGRWNQWGALILTVGIPLTMMSAMAIYAQTQGTTLLLPSLRQIQTSFIILFGTTYRLSLDHPGLSALYTFLSLWPFTWCVIGIYENLKTPYPWNRLRLQSAIGLCAAAILLACFVRLPDIIAHEQFEFPFRLIHTIPLLFLPDIAQFVNRLFNTPWKYRRIAIASVCGLIGAIAMTQWFFTYPQHNALAHAYAPGMSQYEYEAINWIEDVTSSKPFIVLSHQMLAAAALQTRGFKQTITTCHGEHLRYAIPTGAALYRDFLTIARARNVAQILEERKRCYGDTTLVLVVPTYWDPDQRIDHAITPLSLKKQHFGEALTGYIIK